MEYNKDELKRSKIDHESKIIPTIVKRKKKKKKKKQLSVNSLSLARAFIS